MSWFSDLVNQAEEKIKSAVGNTKLTVTVGGTDPGVKLEDARTRKYIFLALVLIAAAFFLGRHYK